MPITWHWWAGGERAAESSKEGHGRKGAIETETILVKYMYTSKQLSSIRSLLDIQILSQGYTEYSCVTPMKHSCLLLQLHRKKVTEIDVRCIPNHTPFLMEWILVIAPSHTSKVGGGCI